MIGEQFKISAKYGKFIPDIVSGDLSKEVEFFIGELEGVVSLF